MAAKFSQTLPPVKSVELYLIEGISEIATTNGGKAYGVIYPPEFVFALDVGLEALVGGTFIWTPVFYGDPEFPEKKTPIIRSLPSRAPRDVIFPRVAGSLMIGLRADVPADKAKAALEAQSLLNVQVSDFLVTADCAPFTERTVCRTLESSLPDIVKYAEANHVVRLIDFSPGWALKRLL
jgi:hypothetical protein